MVKNFGFEHKEALIMSSISIIIWTCLIPVAAILSDKIGRKKLLISGCVMFMVFSYPIFHLFTHGFALALLGQIIFGIILAIYMGPIPAALVEMFPTNVRAFGKSMCGRKDHC